MSSSNRPSPISPPPTPPGRGKSRVIQAPAPVGSGVMNRITGVAVNDGEDVIWQWTQAEGGVQFVSGYTIVRRTGANPVAPPPRKQGPAS